MSDLTDQTILNRYRVETKDVATSCENSDALLLHRSVPVLRRAHSSTGWCCAPRSWMFCLKLGFWHKCSVI